MRRYLQVILLSFIWAAYLFSLGISNKLVSPFTTGVFIRFAVFVMLTVMMAAGKSLHLLKVEKKVLPRLLLIGCMGFLLDFTAFLGSRFGNPAIGSILLKSDIIMVGLLSGLLYHQRFSKKEWALVIIMLGGIALAMGIQPGSLSFHITDLFFILSAFFVSVNAFLIQSVQRDHVDNHVIAYYNNFVTMLLFAGALLISGYAEEFGMIWSNTQLLTALIVGALGQFFIYIFYYRSLHELPVWNVKVILLLIPIITQLYDFLINGTVPTAAQLAGTFVVLLSAMLIMRVQSRKTQIAYNGTH